MARGWPYSAMHAHTLKNHPHASHALVTTCMHPMHPHLRALFRLGRVLLDRRDARVDGLLAHLGRHVGELDERVLGLAVERLHVGGRAGLLLLLAGGCAGRRPCCCGAAAAGGGAGVCCCGRRHLSRAVRLLLPCAPTRRTRFIRASPSNTAALLTVKVLLPQQPQRERQLVSFFVWVCARCCANGGKQASQIRR